MSQLGQSTYRSNVPLALISPLLLRTSAATRLCRPFLRVAHDTASRSPAPEGSRATPPRVSLQYVLSYSVRLHAVERHGLRRVLRVSTAGFILHGARQSRRTLLLLQPPFVYYCSLSPELFVRHAIVGDFYQACLLTRRCRSS